MARRAVRQARQAVLHRVAFGGECAVGGRLHLRPSVSGHLIRRRPGLKLRVQVRRARRQLRGHEVLDVGGIRIQGEEGAPAELALVADLVAHHRLR